MERLQVALEKARAQRSDAAAIAPEPDKKQTPPPASSAPDKGAWAALAEFRCQKKKLLRNRITTFEGGKESAPYDMLRTRVLQQAKHNDWRRVAIVSPHSNCGKSTIAANLAFSLSRQRDRRSIVLDLDLRRSGLTKILDQSGPYGMGDVLGGQVSFADHAKRYGPNVIFGFNNGTTIQTPSEILQDARAKEILDQIEATYEPDLMLFDMPPLMASDDNFGFLQNVDAALLVVAAEKTSMAQIDVAERHIAELTNMMGIVLNKCRYMSGAHGYEYDYY
ncbi:MAG: CpsD/CapB family tyrosine-protein kinase [Rhizobiales bacterium]|nr:CpsD/CapB family tyrosine-protein kinase [Hyphomicrobiales bacterium]